MADISTKPATEAISAETVSPVISSDNTTKESKENDALAEVSPNIKASSTEEVKQRTPSPSPVVNSTQVSETQGSKQLSPGSPPAVVSLKPSQSTLEVEDVKQLSPVSSNLGSIEDKSPSTGDAIKPEIIQHKPESPQSSPPIKSSETIECRESLVNGNESKTNIPENTKEILIVSPKTTDKIGSISVVSQNESPLTNVSKNSDSETGDVAHVTEKASALAKESDANIESKQSSNTTVIVNSTNVETTSASGKVEGNAKIDDIVEVENKVDSSKGRDAGNQGIIVNGDVSNVIDSKIEAVSNGNLSISRKDDSDHKDDDDVVLIVDTSLNRRDSLEQIGTNNSNSKTDDIRDVNDLEHIHRNKEEKENFVKGDDNLVNETWKYNAEAEICVDTCKIDSDSILENANKTKFTSNDEVIESTSLDQPDINSLGSERNENEQAETNVVAISDSYSNNEEDGKKIMPDLVDIDDLTSKEDEKSLEKENVTCGKDPNAETTLEHGKNEEESNKINTSKISNPISIIVEHETPVQSSSSIEDVKVETSNKATSENSNETDGKESASEKEVEIKQTCSSKIKEIVENCNTQEIEKSNGTLIASKEENPEDVSTNLETAEKNDTSSVKSSVSKEGDDAALNLKTAKVGDKEDVQSRVSEVDASPNQEPTKHVEDNKIKHNANDRTVVISEEADAKSIITTKQIDKIEDQTKESQVDSVETEVESNITKTNIGEDVDHEIPESRKYDIESNTAEDEITVGNLNLKTPEEVETSINSSVNEESETENRSQNETVSKDGMEKSDVQVSSINVEEYKKPENAEVTKAASNSDACKVNDSSEDDVDEENREDVAEQNLKSILSNEVKDIVEDSKAGKTVNDSEETDDKGKQSVEQGDGEEQNNKSSDDVEETEKSIANNDHKTTEDTEVTDAREDEPGLQTKKKLDDLPETDVDTAYVGNITENTAICEENVDDEADGVKFSANTGDIVENESQSQESTKVEKDIISSTSKDVITTPQSTDCKDDAKNEIHNVEMIEAEIIIKNDTKVDDVVKSDETVQVAEQVNHENEPNASSEPLAQELILDTNKNNDNINQEAKNNDKIEKAIAEDQDKVISETHQKEEIKPVEDTTVQSNEVKVAATDGSTSLPSDDMKIQEKAVIKKTGRISRKRSPIKTAKRRIKRGLTK